MIGMRVFVIGMLFLLIYAAAYKLDQAVDKQARCQQMGGIFLEVEQICLSQRAVLEMVHEPYKKRRDYYVPEEVRQSWMPRKADDVHIPELRQ